jgi:hypothetical protein
MRVIAPDLESALTEELFGRSTSGYFVEVGAHAPRVGSQPGDSSRPAGPAF